MAQHKTYDLFVREGDTLRFVKGYHQLERVRQYMRTRTAQGLELYARRVILDRGEWYCYSPTSASGLGYAHRSIEALQVIE